MPLPNNSEGTCCVDRMQVDVISKAFKTLARGARSVTPHGHLFSNVPTS